MRSRAERSGLVDELMAQVGDVDDRSVTPMLSKEDLAEIAATYEIGLHSFEHDSMEYQTDKYITQDLHRCLAWCAENLSISPVVYAFPNGSYRESQLRLAREQAIRHVLLVDEKPHMPLPTYTPG